MNFDDLNTILENVPSDVESVLDDDLFDDSELEFPAPELHLEEIVSSESEWESDDEISLANLKRKSSDHREEWTESRSYIVQVLKSFEEPEGPNLPEGLEAPVDIFLHLFSDKFHEAKRISFCCSKRLCWSKTTQEERTIQNDTSDLQKIGPF